MMTRPAYIIPRLSYKLYITRTAVGLYRPHDPDIQLMLAGRHY
jgi:hypothetical protein